MASGLETPSSARSPFAVGFGLLGLLLIGFWLSGALAPAELPGITMSPAQITGMALTYATTPAFLVGALLYADRRTRSNVDLLVASGCVARAAAESTGARRPISWPVNGVLTVLGLLLGFANIGWETLFGALGSPAQGTAISIAAGNILVWIIVVHVFHRRFSSSNAIRKLGRDHAEVDLLRPDVLLPFGRIARLDFLIVVIGFSLSAFQSLDAELRFVNYGAGMAAAFPSGVILLLLPMLGVRRRLREAKAERLETLDRALADAPRSLEPDAVRWTADLLRQREAVAAAREWPLDTTALSRIAIYFVIPPLAWVAGALVELWIEATI